MTGRTAHRVAAHRRATYREELYPDDRFKKLLKKDKNRKPPKSEFIFEDMVKALSRRTELSNFMMSGVEDNILFGEDIEKYLQILCEHIARLTPPGGIVIIHNSYSLYMLEKLGFKNRRGLTDAFEFLNPILNFKIWEKI